MHHDPVTSSGALGEPGLKFCESTSANFSRLTFGISGIASHIGDWILSGTHYPGHGIRLRPREHTDLISDLLTDWLTSDWFTYQSNRSVTDRLIVGLVSSLYSTNLPIYQQPNLPTQSSNLSIQSLIDFLNFNQQASIYRRFSSDSLVLFIERINLCILCILLTSASWSQNTQS